MILGDFESKVWSSSPYLKLSSPKKFSICDSSKAFCVCVCLCVGPTDGWSLKKMSKMAVRGGVSPTWLPCHYTVYLNCVVAYSMAQSCWIWGPTALRKLQVNFVGISFLHLYNFCACWLVRKYDTIQMSIVCFNCPYYFSFLFLAVYALLFLPVNFSDMVIDSMVASGQLKEDLRDKVREAMLKKHHHQNERKLSNRIPLVRSFADIGKKQSDPLLLERNGEILCTRISFFLHLFHLWGAVPKNPLFKSFNASVGGGW